MRVLVCSEPVGPLDARAVAEALIRGWAQVSSDVTVARPLSDGGLGLLAAVAAGQPTARRVLEVAGPDGAPVPASYLVTEDATTWVEAAQAAGLHLLPAGRRDPGRATSRGVGQLLAAAVAGGASRVVVGVGGVGACDGGAGMLEALGARAEPAAGLGSGGARLAGLHSLDVGPALALTADVTLEFATDHDVPLIGSRGVAHGFAAAQGADAQQVRTLEEAMTVWADLLGRAPTGRRVGIALGSGAGGGLGAALYRLGARRSPGIATVLCASGIDEQCTHADLVVCAVGSLDAGSLHGTAMSAVAELALNRAVPVVVLAGKLAVTRRQWVTAGVAAAFELPELPGEPGEPGQRGDPSGISGIGEPDEPGEAGEPGLSGESTAGAIAEGAQRVARTWAR